MKIILQTTESKPEYTHSAEVCVGYDDLSISQVWEELIVPALLAYGFQQESIDGLCE